MKSLVSMALVLGLLPASVAFGQAPARVVESLRLEAARGALEQGVSFFGWAGLAAIPILFLLPEAAAGPAPSLDALASAAPLTVVLAALVYLPSISLILWGATHLDPGRVGLLLMSEVVVGVASAAALTDEPFGLREILGTGLILSAALVEVALVWRRS